MSAHKVGERGPGPCGHPSSYAHVPPVSILYHVDHWIWSCLVRVRDQILLHRIAGHLVGSIVVVSSVISEGSTELKQGWKNE